jgi:sigma-B regulation protein RsbU (phosphoserine phosphatase)
MRRAAREAEAIERQIRLAAEVQRKMVPALPPQRPRLDIGAVYQPSFELGGDLYDFIDFDTGDLGMVVADVSGKGLPASLTMASVRAALRSHAHSIYDIDRIMSQVNRLICRDTRPHEFVSLFYGVVSGDGRRLTYCNAGHEPLVRLRDGQIDVLNTGGLVLGIDPEARYDRGLTDLAAGDVLLLLTDGATEAINAEGQAFGRQRLHESLRRHSRLSAGQLAGQLLSDIRRFVGLARQSDDITLVVLKVR